MDYYSVSNYDYENILYSKTVLLLLLRVYSLHLAINLNQHFIFNRGRNFHQRLLFQFQPAADFMDYMSTCSFKNVVYQIFVEMF